MVDAASGSGSGLACMEIRGIDPCDTTWELDHARYRVYCWDVPAVTAQAPGGV